MNNKEKNLPSEENTLQENSSDKDTSKETEKVSEENKGWEFDAKAPMLENNIKLGGGFQIDVDQQPVAYKNEKIKKAKDKEHIVINRKALRIGLLSAVSAILVALLIFFGVRFFAFPNSSEIMSPGNVALTVGNTKVSVGMYNMYYNMVVSNYKQYATQGYFDIDFSKDLSEQFTTDENNEKISWEEMFKQSTIKQLQYVIAYYEPAVEAGFTLSDEQKEAIEENIESMKKSASEAGSNFNKYIEANYGKYCGVATLRKFFEQRALYESYYNRMNLKISLPFSDIEKYYEEHKTDYTSFAMVEMKFSLEDSEFKTIEDVKAKAQEYCNKIKNLEDLKSLLPEISGELIEQAVEQGYFADSAAAIKSLASSLTVTYNNDVIESNFGKEILTWLQASDRADGDTTYQINEDMGYAYIFLNTSEAKPDSTELYSVRHILISPTEELSDVEKATEEQWNAAQEKAEKIVEEYNSGEKTELSFAELAEKNSADVNSTSNGQSGSYGGIIGKTSLGVMVPEFENWATDDARKYGDVGIVKSKYGYHIMYFIYDGPTYLFNVMDDANMEKISEFINSVTYNEHSAFKKTTVVEPVSKAANS